MRIRYWSSDVCSSDLDFTRRHVREVKRLSIGTEAGAVGAADARNKRLDRPVAGKAIETAIGFSGAALVDAAAEKIAVPVARSEERRGGKECVSTCNLRGSRHH